MILNQFKEQKEVDQVLAIDLRIRAILNNDILYGDLFEPLTVLRVYKDNIHPTGTSVWYARNDGGKLITLGNKVFFKGKQNVRGVYGKPYSTNDLIMHEICHNINYRVDVSPFARYYADRTLFGAVAASSTHPAETITDAFANYFMGTLWDIWLMRNIIIPYVKVKLDDLKR